MHRSCITLLYISALVATTNVACSSSLGNNAKKLLMAATEKETCCPCTVARTQSGPAIPIFRTEPLLRNQLSVCEVGVAFLRDIILKNLVLFWRRR
ncbi:hypothetical protein V6N11_012635 [Hibiscus sabdariffa]|uniref:Secreted protein n=1 Tax=Hibiscus sabdariffa TaxID=183260 RepID=A0ABR2QC10_9ROSI